MKDAINFTNAYYIKLGVGGKWADSSINEDKARIGYAGWRLEQINTRSWEFLKTQYRHGYKNDASATTDLNALENFVVSNPEDIWVTFHSGKLWWCRLANGPLQEDDISKYRDTSGAWKNQDVNGRELLINQIPGSISKIQGFRGTVCKIHEVEVLKRLINGIQSDAYQHIFNANSNLISQVENGLKLLHWKDFEALVDLVFREAGWQRISVLGETMKFTDMDLREPITNELYQVQVKSAASLSDFQQYADNFSHGSYRKLYFVVHSPEPNLVAYQATECRNDIELIFPNKLAALVVDMGLTKWLLDKIR